jgi:hypothetical protein
MLDLRALSDVNQAVGVQASILREARRDTPRTLQITADGRSRAVLELELPANALVHRFDLRITATRAELVRAVEAADVRPAEGKLGMPAFVVDFAALRTVNALLLPLPPGGHKVYPWLGTEFEDRAIDLPSTGVDQVARATRGDGAAAELYIYALPETRSERLLIELGDATADPSAIIPRLELSLPELPANLSLRINGGSPVWEHPGSVQLGAGDALSESAWNELGQRRVSIASALAELSGDAANPAARALTLELISGVPGRLLIEVEQQELQLLHRLGLGAGGDLALEFLSEGRQELALQMPAGAAGPKPLRGLRLTLIGELPPERVLPPLGPDPSGIGELVLGRGRAACVRLDGGAGLAELTGVRLPLASVAGGAEARVVLWRDEGGGPVEALSGAASGPVTWEDAPEQWLSFTFDEPIPLDPAAPPWAAIIVSRGEVRWALAGADGAGRYPLRLGAPQGPWRALPAVFGPTTALGSVAGRVRVIGRAADAQPLPPLLLSLDGQLQDQPVTPSASGLRLQLAGAPEAQGGASRLRLTSRTAGKVTLREVDAITDA